MAALAAGGQLEQQLRNTSSMDTQLLLKNLLVVLEQSHLCKQPVDVQTSEEELRSWGRPEFCTEVRQPVGNVQYGQVCQTDITPSAELSSSSSEQSGVWESVEGDSLGWDAPTQASHWESGRCTEADATGGEHRALLLSLSVDALSSSPQLTQVPGCSSQLVRQLRVECFGTQGWHVNWPVAVARLKSSDKQIVSPAFEVMGAVFKLMLKPKAMGNGKGESGFRKAKGRGHIELKCEVGSAATLPAMVFSFTINGICRGPVIHDFTGAPVACLPRETEWNFLGAVDKSSPTQNQTFTVHLDIAQCV